ncbi:MAG: hypothetical protein AAF790_04580, partial [Planctomycetota bacterium]
MPTVRLKDLTGRRGFLAKLPAGFLAALAPAAALVGAGPPTDTRGEPGGQSNAAAAGVAASVSSSDAGRSSGAGLPSDAGLPSNAGPSADAGRGGATPEELLARMRRLAEPDRR